MPKSEIPERFVNSIEKILSYHNIKDIKSSSLELENYLRHRQLPVEQDEYNQTVSFVESQVLSEDSVLEPFLSEKQRESLDNSRQHKIETRLKKLIYHWEPVGYTQRTALAYLMGRTTAEFSALCRVFHEIAVRDPHFKPQTLCDFGSGIGSVLWASHRFWGETLNEFLCVDVSKDMSDLAELILRGGRKSNDHWLHGISFRQFLPASDKIKYDLVVSAYSLLELSSLKNRIQTVDILWRKTNNYLILIEQGSNAGFEAVLQARDYVLGLHETDKPSNSHVFSPCPNDTWCPRFVNDNTPCNFVTRYGPLLPNMKDYTRSEVFTFVVLKKGPRSDSEERWPRVVRDPCVRSKHVVCRLCTHKGNLTEVVLTKGKSSQALYRTGRKSRVGDLLPVDELESLGNYGGEIHGETENKDSKLTDET